MTVRQIEGDSQTVVGGLHGAANAEAAADAGAPTFSRDSFRLRRGRGASTTSPLMTDDNPRTEHEHHDR